MKYYSYYSEETRGFDHNEWGYCTFLYEVADDNYVTRQIEIYDKGPTLKYGSKHKKDEYGFLMDQPFQGDKEKKVKVINAEKFEKIWNSKNPSLLSKIFKK
jgi:hypothetical protein